MAFKKRSKASLVRLFFIIIKPSSIISFVEASITPDTTSSTRRFFALPAGVLLSAMGFVSPYPMTLSFWLFTPFFTR